MLVTFVVGVVVVFLAYLVSLTRNPRYLFVSFIILFFYLALRYDFGNDYMNYYNIFDDIKRSNWSEVYRLANVNQFGETMEFGYIYLNKVFSSFTNFYFFIAFQSFLFCFVYYQLIAKHVNYHLVWLSLFILVFHISLLVRNLSGIRQAFAVFCFIYSIRYLINRSFIRYLFCIILAVLFHYSAIILLPLYFVFTTKQVSKLESMVYVALYILLVFSGEFILYPIKFVVSNYLPKYFSYIENQDIGSVSSGLGVMINSVLYIIILLFGEKGSASDRVFYRIIAVFILLSPISMVVGNFDRLTLYFAPALLIIIPHFITNKDAPKLLKTTFIVIFLMMTVYNAYLHYTSPVFYDKNYYYNTLLFGAD